MGWGRRLQAGGFLDHRHPDELRSTEELFRHLAPGLPFPREVSAITSTQVFLWLPRPLISGLYFLSPGTSVVKNPPLSSTDPISIYFESRSPCRLTQLMKHCSYRLVVLVPQLSLQLQGGSSLLRAGQKMHGDEPVAERKLGTVHDGVRPQAQPVAALLVGLPVVAGAAALGARHILLDVIFLPCYLAACLVRVPGHEVSSLITASVFIQKQRYIMLVPNNDTLDIR